jgi:hypothetical protein
MENTTSQFSFDETTGVNFREVTFTFSDGTEVTRKFKNFADWKIAIEVFNEGRRIGQW